ncbi:MAG TPA: hypothetical protein VJZ75_00175, partial [Candidatus Bathyarchaeia archaeon]|nr:hypothetical protein [Candidatus Bathyarchaeia archaeon]
RPEKMNDLYDGRKRTEVRSAFTSRRQEFKTVKNLCQTAERTGYDLFTVTDHFMNMANPAGPSNHP